MRINRIFGRSALAATFLLCVELANIGRCAPPPNFDQLIDQGWQALSDHRYNDAVTPLLQAYAIRKTGMSAYLLFLAYAGSNDRISAIWYGEDAWRATPPIADKFRFAVRAYIEKCLADSQQSDVFGQFAMSQPRTTKDTDLQRARVQDASTIDAKRARKEVMKLFGISEAEVFLSESATAAPESQASQISTAQGIDPHNQEPAMPTIGEATKKQ